MKTHVIAVLVLAVGYVAGGALSIFFMGSYDRSDAQFGALLGVGLYLSEQCRQLRHRVDDPASSS